MLALTIDRIAFAWEPVAELLKEANLRDLIAEYWEELSPHKEQLQLAVDYEKMIAWEQVGIYRVWTARAEGVLAGFIGFQIVPHLNYRHTLFAFDMGHYLSPAYRGKGWAGIKMWAAACEALKALGVKVVIAHDNSVRPLDSFFGRLGFEPRSTLYSLIRAVLVLRMRRAARRRGRHRRQRQPLRHRLLRRPRGLHPFRPREREPDAVQHRPRCLEHDDQRMVRHSCRCDLRPRKRHKHGRKR